MSRGSALLISLITLAGVTIVAATTVATLRSLKRESLWQARVLQAQALAETGASDALAQLASNPAWRTGFSAKALSGGTYDVSLTSPARPAVKSTGYSRAMALLGRAVRSVQFKAESLPLQQLSYGAIADRDLSFGDSSAIDSYNSETDPSPPTFGLASSVRANDDIQVSPVHVAVFGDARWTGSGPPAGTFTGTSSAVASTVLPSQSGSGYLNENDNQTGLNPASVYNPANKNVLVPIGSTATIRSGVYYFRKLDINGRLETRLVDGPVVIYLDGAMTVNGSLANLSKLPANLYLYGQSVFNVAINSAEPIHAALVAREADVALQSVLYGAVAGRDVLLTGTAKIHQDLSLQRATAHAVRVIPGSWTTSYRR